MVGKKQKPLLSIGMIFKNEIRCLERCLKSLQPLREAVPCELVMADTGSEDGSREVAAKYADILFDFPWINDFSAARNAVMDKCCGKWYLTIDADEWLEDIDELVNFLRQNSSRRVLRSGKGINEVMVVQRSYDSYDAALRDNYMDLYVPRMLLMSTGLRYSGAIHEVWRFTTQSRYLVELSKTILHHDGYVGVNINDEAGQVKQERNMVLLREELSHNPDDLRTLKQCVDSSTGDEQWDYACRLVELIQQKAFGWQMRGPECLHAVIRTAIIQKKSQQRDEWIALAEEMFPESFAVRLDIEVTALHVSWNRNDFADVVRRGERFLLAYDDYHAGRGDQYSSARMCYSVNMAAPRWKSFVQIFFAAALVKEGKPDKSWEILQNLDFAFLNKESIIHLIANLKDLQHMTDYDVASILQRLWATINSPDFARGEECRKSFFDEGTCAFLPSNFAREQAMDVKRPAYTLFLPLGEQNRLGLAAMLMEGQNPAELERLLELVEDWETLPEISLCRALLAGAKFPVKPMTLTEMDNLAGRLATVFPQMVTELAVKEAAGDFAANLPTLLWTRGLVLAAVQACVWQEEQDFELVQAFADVERVFLPKYYALDLLCEENIGLLPPMHAFGWYCVRAFDALGQDGKLEYVQLLRKGLELCPDMKAMVNFLSKNTPALQEKPEPSAELLAMAKQVRSILAAYAPDDPAVTAIKASPVYQQIAYLLEEPQNSNG